MHTCTVLYLHGVVCARAFVIVQLVHYVARGKKRERMVHARRKNISTMLLFLLIVFAHGSNNIETLLSLPSTRLTDRGIDRCDRRFVVSHLQKSAPNLFKSHTQGRGPLYETIPSPRPYRPHERLSCTN